MPAIKVPTSFNIDLEFDIPEFFRRLIALVIDVLVLIAYGKIALEMLKSISRHTNYRNSDAEYDLQALIILFFLPILIYHIVMEITMNGQSIGKRIMHLRVVNENGGKASISQFLIRWLLRDIWFVFLFLVGVSSLQGSKESLFLVILAVIYFIVETFLVVGSRKGQRIGDMLARTIIIRTNVRGNIEETVFQEVADNYTPSFPQIMQLSDRDINAIKGILETARRKGDANMAEAASLKIQRHLKLETTMPPFDFLDTLLKDYNYLSVK